MRAQRSFVTNALNWQPFWSMAVKLLVLLITALLAGCNPPAPAPEPAPPALAAYSGEADHSFQLKPITCSG
jgi:hypothetical protein